MIKMMGKGGGRKHRCIKVPTSSTLGFRGTGVPQVSFRYIQVTWDAPLAAHRPARSAPFVFEYWGEVFFE